MIKTNKVTIGTDIYTIDYDGEMPITNALGCIAPATLEIRLRLIGPSNVMIPERQIMKTLMHEIVHAIDFNIHPFIINEKEDECEDYDNDDSELAIDMFSDYIIDNLIGFIDDEISIEEFVEFCNITEIKIKRHYMFFEFIRRVFRDNVVLFNEFLDVFSK